MQIKKSIELNASASAVWEVLGEQFADVSKWADSIVKSSLDGPLEVGGVRTCHIKAVGPIAAGEIKEKLTHFNRDSRSLTYLVLSGTPIVMDSIENAWTIEEMGNDRCRVTSRITLRMKWWALPLTPLMFLPLGKAVRDFLGQLKRRVEIAH